MRSFLGIGKEGFANQTGSVQCPYGTRPIGVGARSSCAALSDMKARLNHLESGFLKRICPLHLAAFKPPDACCSFIPGIPYACYCTIRQTIWNWSCLHSTVQNITL